MRKPFKPSPLAVALQTATLLVVAGGVFAILITDVARHGSERAKLEAASNVERLAWPNEGRSE